MVVGETNYGTPVFHFTGKIPDGLLPKGFGQRAASMVLGSEHPFSCWLLELLSTYPACVIVRMGRVTRIFKISKSCEVFTITARSIREEDRKRLAADGVLR